MLSAVRLLSVYVMTAARAGFSAPLPAAPLRAAQGVPLAPAADLPAQTRRQDVPLHQAGEGPEGERLPL